MNLPYDTSMEEVLVKIRQTSKNPNIGEVRQVKLKEGPQAFKVATLFEIKDGTTGEFHHFSLRIDHIKRTKVHGWEYKPSQSTTLDGRDRNEIEALYRFLHLALEIPAGRQSGDVHLVRGQDYQKISLMLEAIPDLASNEKFDLVRTVLKNVNSSDESIESVIHVLEDADIGLVGHFAAASRFLEYRMAYIKMEELVSAPNTSENDLQKHLESNPWMFGSEYSKLLSRRDWVRDESLDFMLRRTIDGYLEVIEIKKAVTGPLFNYDKSHDSFYPAAQLSTVLGQCFKYLESIERERDRILVQDQDDALKIRARIIIGRDGDELAKSALRNLNAHLHSVEVLTYDQLLRIAKRVLEVFYDNASIPERTIPLSEFGDDIPF